MHTSIRQCVLFVKIFNGEIRIFSFLICGICIICGSAFRISCLFLFLACPC
ncbi:hypothetical protein KsCSTR_31430 [Candidatus Kuenenia stuttgartiensis]|uniref:Uncharacterized protein n=1 Tax=Kuenenia stuttgartiensis TaxID=174633 RepID=Q1Q4Y8_KUEST|nr:hypothetical protein KsCSTR_31430 [Candidatus Kuenenia stuttgartiensis]CAJ75078.1 unknown protein [Candidatus Kuenenia stuttgartiensis]